MKLDHSDVAQLADRPLPRFDAGPLIDFTSFERGAVINGLGPLAMLARAHGCPFDKTAAMTFFGVRDASHSFYAPRLDWGFRPTEPQATDGLAHLLMAGDASLRARRIAAFLRALGTPSIPSVDVLEQAEARAEVDRIDLEILIPTADPRKRRPIIIEAKFGHHLTTGQLSRYLKARRNSRYDYANGDFVLLAENDRAAKRLKGRQVTKWRLVTWQTLWLRFERARPEEDNPDLSAFLSFLWNRVGRN
ncbi:PD-(D/E)XK nuclease family protein [Rhodobium gokarnense]|uniref:PD-(D/E)XK nuclease superfamily protein n=1 Tax=Rhodobium gokarnense TaxID=364296 RepID=A0ABT3HH88_9HYPH|nr:PD-(D/E)XK nuclease family protein [Rhodobium gokarnense]MCW2309763.1 hypothetical protein [Rhodobium gokarnense]